MGKKLKATIVYHNAAGRRFEKKVTGTKAEIQAEADRMESLPDVKRVSIEWS